MIVKSPLKQQSVRPNLRKVEIPKKNPSYKSDSSKSNTAPRYAQKDPSKKSLKPKISPWKVILSTIILGVFGFTYLTHVFSTQKLLRDVQVLESEYNRARNQHDALKLQYERMIGPTEIYRQAEAQGFVNAGPADKLIVIED